MINTYDVINFDNLKVGFISWISPEIKEDALRWIQTVDASVICGHFEINSFEIIKGLVCSKGYDPELFERFDRVFSGHFHIRATNGLIQYIGNPFQTNWGEYGYPKGFGVYDTQKNELVFINNPNNVYEIINYNDNIDIDKFDETIYKDKIVRIIVKTNKNKRKLEAILDRINPIAHSIELIDDKEIIIDDSNIESIPTDTKELISQFLDTCKIDHLDRSQLESMIFEIYHNAIEQGMLSC